MNNKWKLRINEINNEWIIQYMNNSKIRIVQLIQFSLISNSAIVCFWLNIRPAGSGTAKLFWKERLLALHFHERGLYHPLLPN